MSWLKQLSQSSFTWVKYADDVNGTNMTSSSTGKAYVGYAFNKLTATPSTNPADYYWSAVSSGSSTPSYTWVKYADDASGTNMSDSPTGKVYLGLAFNKSTATKSIVATDYQWSLINSGSSSSGTGLYTWVMYADSILGANMSTNPLYKPFVGLAFNKTTSTPAYVASNYQWYPAGEPIVTTKDNEIRPLYLKSPEGWHQLYHPKVLYFSSGFGGYKYWMAATPFPWQEETGEPYENPCMYASNDGFVWIVPNGVVNPLDTPEASNTSYLSDTHMVFRTDTNTLEVWYRPTGGSVGNDGIMRRTTTDGINWTPREILVQQNNPTASGINTGTISPAVIWNSSNQYEMWYIDGTTNNDQDIWHAVSSDGKAWTNVAKCNLSGYTLDPYPWHMDCVYNNGHYYLVSYTKAGRIDLFQATDGVNFTFLKTLLNMADARGRDFYKDGLYRACLVSLGTRDSAPYYRLYYTGNENTEKFSGIGVMEGQLLDMKQIDGDLWIRKQNFYKGIEIVNSPKVQSNITIADTGEAIGFDYSLKQPYFLKADNTKRYFSAGTYNSSVPVKSTATGIQGDFSADANYFYICYANNSWIRVPKDNTWV